MSLSTPLGYPTPAARRGPYLRLLFFTRGPLTRESQSPNALVGTDPCTRMAFWNCRLLTPAWLDGSGQWPSWRIGLPDFQDASFAQSFVGPSPAGLTMNSGQREYANAQPEVSDSELPDAAPIAAVQEPKSGYRWHATTRSRSFLAT